MGTPELLGRYEAPFVPFPENPTLVFIDNMPVYEYIRPSQFVRQVSLISSMLDLDKFDAVAYNANGGKFIADLVAVYKGYYKEMVKIAYHMAKDGNPVRVDKKIPDELKDKNILVFEDVLDTGGCAQKMKEDCPRLTMIVVSHKLGVPNQIVPEDVIPIFKTVNKWQTGAGMNIDIDGDLFYPENALRNYPGIAIRPPDEVLREQKGKMLSFS